MPNRDGECLAYDAVILGANNYRIGLHMNGGGYRYFELALALKDLGLRVAIVAPRPTDFENCPIDVLDQSTLSHDDIAACSRVFIFCLLEDLVLVESLKRNGRTLIYDSYLSPVEQLTYEEVLDLGDQEKIEAHFRDAVRKHNRFNELADHFIVGEPEEKLLKLGELINTHQVGLSDYRTLSERMSPLPVPCYSRHSTPDKSLAARGNAILWNGGLWNHYGGTDLIIDAVKSLHDAGRDISFRFLYPREQTIAHGLITQRLADENIPYIELGLPGGRHPDFFSKQEILAGCRAFVLLYESVLQIHLFLSMRLREVMLFEKPIVVSDHGVMASFVKEHEIGLTVDNTAEALRDAMELLLTDEDLYERLVANVRKLKERYALEQYVPPIAAVIDAANRGAA